MDSYKLEYKTKRVNEFALKNAKHHTNPEYLPKFQQYNDYYFPNYSLREKLLPQNNHTLETDSSIIKTEVFNQNKLEKGMRFIEFKSTMFF